MYLQTLKIDNFRKYKELEINFTKGLNLLVGENDSGKTAIIDAIKYVLSTQSFEYIRPNYEDFHLEKGAEEYLRSNSFSVECIFTDFEDMEAKSFLEWLSYDDEGNYFFKIFLRATRKGSKVFYEIKAGLGSDSGQISGEARDLLRVTYLKPLRDAVSELAPKRGSRLSQILDSHDQFTDKDNHRLIRILNLTNKAIEKYFTDYEGKDLLEDVNSYLASFTHESNPLHSKFQVTDSSLKSILEKLTLKIFNHQISENNIQGLGSHNLLYISAELLLLKKLNYSGLKLGLIEEIEAHLHPQTQIRLIEAIQDIGDTNNIQFILTSHSPNLASKVKLENLIVCKDGYNYPMGKKYTKLRAGDYYFLERFLDSTKTNLFFAAGVILVEGDAENILLPIIANLINRSLSKYGVSIVNVGSTAFLRYANIFLREGDLDFNMPVSLITDVDVKPVLCEPTKKTGKDDIKAPMTEEDVESQRVKTIGEKVNKYPCPIKSFIAPYWTLEYSIARGVLAEYFWQAVYICWKTKTKDYIYSEELKQQLIGKANLMFQTWEVLTADQKAFNIYKEHMLDKQLSKAVVAQVFSQILNENVNKIGHQEIAGDENIQYLVNAINYATGHLGC